MAFALHENIAGRLVVNVQIKPAVPFAELSQRASKVSLPGLSVPIAGIDDFIALKRVAARPND